MDSRIVNLALAIQRAEPKVPTILVTKDINLRIKADIVGLEAEDYESDRVPLTDLYTGMFEMNISAEKMARFRTEGELDLNGHGKYFPNEYCTLTEETNPKRTALTKVDATGAKLIPILDCREGVWGIKPRNREQHFAFDALLDDRIKLVTLMGKAGTGKTLHGHGGRLEAHGDGPGIPPPDRRPAHRRRRARDRFSARHAGGEVESRGCSPSTTRWNC